MRRVDFGQDLSYFKAKNPVTMEILIEIVAGSFHFPQD